MEEDEEVSAEIHYMRACARLQRRLGTCVCVPLRLPRASRASRYPVVPSRPAPRALNGLALLQPARQDAADSRACIAPVCAWLRRLRLGEHLTLWLDSAWEVGRGRRRNRTPPLAVAVLGGARTSDCGVQLPSKLGNTAPSNRP